jgi:hypothetical protein
MLLQAGHLTLPPWLLLQPDKAILESTRTSPLTGSRHSFDLSLWSTIGTPTPVLLLRFWKANRAMILGRHLPLRLTAQILTMRSKERQRVRQFTVKLLPRLKSTCFPHIQSDRPPNLSGSVDPIPRVIFTKMCCQCLVGHSVGMHTLSCLALNHTFRLSSKLPE